MKSALRKYVVLFFFTTVLFISCGDDSEFVGANGIRPDLIDANYTDPAEQLFFKENYSGYLVMHLDEKLKVRLVESKLTCMFPSSVASLRATDGSVAIQTHALDRHVGFQPPRDDIVLDCENTISSIQSIIDKHPEVKIERYITDKTEEELDEWRAELEERSGMKLANWNSVFKLYAAPFSAVEIYRDLKDVEGIISIYPNINPVPMPMPEIVCVDVGATLCGRPNEGSHIGLPLQNSFTKGSGPLTGVPDLTVLQGYLFDDAKYGGLNAKAAWDVGITGTEVRIGNLDSGLNVDHEDLPNASKPDCQFNPWYCSPAAVAHGTATYGILAAKHNGKGINGFAPDADVFWTNGAFGAPGKILTIQSQAEPCVGKPNIGCLPYEAALGGLNTIKYAIADGATVIEGSGNGGVSLDDKSIYYSYQVDLSDPKNDSGSIIVGASYGTQGIHKKAYFSTCGSRVNAYAWGIQVVTTTYPATDGSFTYKWHNLYKTDINGNPAPIPPNSTDNTFFVDAFQGTSASAPQVAGAAALVMSYAKNKLFAPFSKTRYITGLKMREILVNSGVSQDTSGVDPVTKQPTSTCNIGKQPDVGKAIKLVDTQWNNWKNLYPILTNSNPTRFTVKDDINKIWQSGLGIICTKGDLSGSDPLCPIDVVCKGSKDPLCPDEYLWPRGSKVAKGMDMDGDGKADLVSWTKKETKVDLSNNGFGKWDLTITLPIVNPNPTYNGEWVWPYFDDMDSDGRVDVVIYDKENGIWYIDYTTTDKLNNNWNKNSWDAIVTTNIKDNMVVDPINEPINETKLNKPITLQYCRPVPGNYDGDTWVDLAVACSDGHWYIWYGSLDRYDNIKKNKTLIINSYDINPQYLSSTELSTAPGWAYLIIHPSYSMGIAGSDSQKYLGYKYPDTITNEGKFIVWTGTTGNRSYNKRGEWPGNYKGNDLILFPAFYSKTGYASVGVKSPNGTWLMTTENDMYVSLIDLPPKEINFGNSDCHSIAIDIDNDQYADRVVQCPNEWILAQSKDGEKHISLGYNTDEFTLPGRPYFGGISYLQSKLLIQSAMTLNPGKKIPVPVDMVREW